VDGALKLAWGLTAFIVVLGLVLWIATGRAVFATFLVLGVLTAVGAWLSGRSLQAQTTTRPTASPEEKS